MGIKNKTLRHKMKFTLIAGLALSVQAKRFNPKQTPEEMLGLHRARNFLTLVCTQHTASEKRDSSTLIAISTRSRRVKPPDTLTTLKLRTIANVTTGVTLNLKLTAWPKTACSITASGEEISNS